MTGVRRSARTRQQTTSIYDDAKKAIEEKDGGSDDSERDSDDEDMSSQGDKSDVESEAEAEPEEADENSNDDSSSDEEEPFKPKTPTKSRATAAASSAQKKKSQNKVQIKVGRQPAASRTTKAAARGGGSNKSRRGVQSALATLARKVLDKSENADNSLVAALLQSHKGTTKSSRVNDKTRTIYTTQLETIARSVIEEHRNDPNKAQTQLLNLLFRSVGGTVETNIDPTKSSLEDMDNEEWAKVVTDLVDEMRHTRPDSILFCADPDGAVHAAAVASNKELDTAEAAPASLGVREYRKIYEEFWYVLGTVALTEGIASNNDGDADSDDESEDDEGGRKRRHTMSFTTTSRFDAEVVRDLIQRVTELVTVGQPDVRAAATVAALQLGHAVLNRTAELGAKLDVATRQFEAAGGKKDGQRSKKAESFRHQMDSLKRTKADLEEIVLSSIIQGVFMHRYRDSDMFIRATALKSLSRMTLQRPDLFLMDKYLKYFGWMMSDKAASVRIASFDGLHAPFLAQNESSKSRKNAIDLQVMANVIHKFLPRIADGVLDSNVVVQEHAMALILSLEREQFLDDVLDDSLWSQINLRALATNSSPSVRRDALYFVMDQLEAFDEDETTESRSEKRGRAKDKLTQSSERMMVQRIETLACWTAEALVDGPIPLDKIRIHLADYIVQSLRDMPEHKALVTNWNAMLRAIGDDSVAATKAGEGANDRAAVATQRVLVQMLSCAAQAEVAAVAEPKFLARDVDPDLAVRMEGSTALTKPKKHKSGKASSSGMPHEVLSVALLNSLPDLLIKFKGDPTILGSITSLPRYILPSVFSLPQRKNDFATLVKNLCDVYLESSDEFVLQSIALSLSSLSSGGHTRVADARLHLQRVATTLTERLTQLFAEKADRKGANIRKPASKRKNISKRKRGNVDSASTDSSDDDSDDEMNSEARDVEYAISSCLRRLRVLSKRCNLAELLDDSASDDDSVRGTVADLCDTIVSGIEERLKERIVTFDEMPDGEDGDDAEEVRIPEIWKSGDQSIHEVVAASVKESLSLLLSITAWKLSMAQKDGNIILENDEDIVMETEEVGDGVDKYGVLSHRDQLIALLVLSFEQYLPATDYPSERESIYSKEHLAFSDQVQTQACQITGDMRSLFQKEWAEAASPLLRDCALTNDQSLAGGLVRYFRAKEENLRIARESQEGADLGKDLLLPLVRSVAPNWKLGNRREAGVALAHVTGSAPEAGKIVSDFSRIVKKIDPVRLLEAHMASLRQGYEEWVHNEPDDLQSERPTDEEMAAFEEAEKKYEEEFHLLEQQAGRLSQSLGVGKLSDSKLAPSLLGFVRNGIKFAFSHDDNDGELVLGSRLSFLSILSKYATWIRKNTEQKEAIGRDLEDAEAGLRQHPDFHEVHEDDLAALGAFRKALGIEAVVSRLETSPHSVTDESRASMGDDYSDDGDDSVTKASVGTARSARRRLSQGGASVSSVRSKLSSAQNSLSPLYEEDASMEDSPRDQADEVPPSKRRRSIASSLSVSTIGQSQPTIAEGSDTDDGSLESS